MAPNAPVNAWRLTIPEEMHTLLMRHLFPGDGDEHGAIILAGICESDRGLRLVARELHLAMDGQDYVPGKYGYRMLKAQFIQSRILRARKFESGLPRDPQSRGFNISKLLIRRFRIA